MMSKKFFFRLLYLLIALNVFFLSALVAYKVTLKGETATVPDLYGKTLEEAKSELESKRLVLLKGEYALHQSLERGLIISQDPSPGSRISWYKPVEATLSAGKEKVTVPRLIGLMHQNIGPLLTDSGLRKGTISYVYTPKYAAGKIIAQHPQPEEEAVRQAEVNLLVSQGEKEDRYLMPDLIGKKASSVISDLKDMGFQVRDISTSFYHESLESGIIIKQHPPQGYRVLQRERITLEVSK